MRVFTLLSQLRRMRERRVLLGERRARGLEPQARAADSFCTALESAYKRYTKRLEALSQKPAEDTEDAFFALHSAVITPVASLAYLTVDSYARERLHRRIAAGATLGAVQQRFMPEVRRVVRRAVHDALRARETPEVKVGSRTYVDRDEAAADNLTACFVRAFFPTWGATTTAELVRKARSTARKVRPSKRS